MTIRFFVLALLALGVSPSAMAALPQYNCPNASLGEVAADCPWAAIARELSDAPAGTDLAKLLKKRAPGLYSQIHSEKDSKTWHSLWGWSINFDELAHGIVVDPAILKTLYSVSGVPAPLLGPGTPDNVQHAGLEHTYGYLFSVLKTAFGYKRARWVSGEIDRGFGFQTAPISPSPKRGTLFGNVTYLAGRIAFRHEPQALVLLEGRKHKVEPELTRVKFDKLKITRVEETAVLGGPRTVTIRTDLMTFPVAPAPAEGGAPAPNDTLLVYSYLDSGDGGASNGATPPRPVLITAFPVTATFGSGIMKPTTLGANQPIITRYNAYIPGMTGRTDLKGTRIVTERADSQ